MNRPNRHGQRWLLDPGDADTAAAARRLVEELRPFDGRLVYEVESAVMELNRIETRESTRKLRTELVRTVIGQQPMRAEGELDPSEIRLKVFSSLWERGVGFLTTKEDLFASGEDVLGNIAREIGSTPESIIDGLFADTPGERRVVVPPGSPEAAAIQALRAVNLARLKRRLRKAVGLVLVLPAAVRRNSPYVNIFWQLKRERLMYEALSARSFIRLAIAGPGTLFERTTAYGNRLFDFCHALLRHPAERWHVTADILDDSNTPGGRLAAVELDASMRSLFFDTNEGEAPVQARSSDEEAFRRYFEKLETGWDLSYEGALVPLEGPGMSRHRFIIPDFVARSASSPSEVLIEIVGYWRPEYLRRKVEQMTLVRDRRIILLVNNKLALGQAESAMLDNAAVNVLRYDSREQLKEAAREVGRMLTG